MHTTAELYPVGPLRIINDHGRVVRRSVDANPGLKVNRSNNVACITTFLYSYSLSSLKLFKHKN